jgi:hypothetical protein
VASFALDKLHRCDLAANQADERPLGGGRSRRWLDFVQGVEDRLTLHRLAGEAQGLENAFHDEVADRVAKSIGVARGFLKEEVAFSSQGLNPALSGRRVKRKLRHRQARQS